MKPCFPERRLALARIDLLQRGAGLRWLRRRGPGAADTACSHFRHTICGYDTV